MINFQGQSVLVTGGARGIGRACCEMFADAGAQVAVNYCLERPAAEDVVKTIVTRGGDAFALAADVSIPEEAEMMVDATVGRFGKIDILVNNAGIWRGSRIEELSDREWSTMIGINLTGTFHMIRAAVPHMKRAGSGRIINISSTAGQRGESMHAHYAATKGGVIALTKSLASELAGDGILTNCVAPGWVNTDMSREALEGNDRQSVLDVIPLGRPGSAQEIAGAVVFLGSELATFINGEILNVNGGAVLCG